MQKKDYRYRIDIDGRTFSLFQMSRIKKELPLFFQFPALFSAVIQKP